jgi:predicted transcriptional regulator
MERAEQEQIVQLTAEIVSAYVANNNVRREDLAALIGDVHAALVRVPSAPVEPPQDPQEPAVPIRRSVTPDHIFCLEDGKKFKSLKRHLRTDHNTTPDEYRAKWGLKSDYPMVAPNYAQARSQLARSMGLGRKKASEAGAAPVRRGRKPKS